MRIKGTDILKFLLAGIGAAGIILVAVTAPGLFLAFGPFKPNFSKRQVKQSFDYAHKHKLITFRKTANGYLVTLTEEGKQRLQKFRLGELELKKPKKWDGKWRLIIFDIPEKYMINRLVFARKLKELGLFQLQKSVWAWPYEIEVEVDLMKEAYEIRPFVRVITATDIDRQSDLRKFFNL